MIERVVQVIVGIPLMAVGFGLTAAFGLFAFIGIPLLVVGWFLQRDRILRIAALREGVTGPYPIGVRNPAASVRRDGDGS